jgi:hypothetical protein
VGEFSASRPGCPLPPGKDPRYSLNKRLGGPQNRSGHRSVRKNPFPLSGFTVMIVALRTSETSVYSNKTTHRYIPEGSELTLTVWYFLLNTSLKLDFHGRTEESHVSLHYNVSDCEPGTSQLLQPAHCVFPCFPAMHIISTGLGFVQLCSCETVVREPLLGKLSVCYWSFGFWRRGVS